VTKVIITLFLLVSLAACGGKKDDKASTDQKSTDQKASGVASTPTGDWQDYDLSEKKLPVIAKGPKGATLSENFLGVEITHPEKFSYVVGNGTAKDVKQALADLKKDEILKFEKVVMEDADGFIAKIGSGFVLTRHATVNKVDYMMICIPLYALPTEEDAKSLYAAMGELRKKS
jgi:hypothetical protein